MTVSLIWKLQVWPESIGPPMLYIRVPLTPFFEPEGEKKVQW